MPQEKEAQIKFYKTREDKEIEKVIALENKVKALDDIVYKTGQSVQTMNMLNQNCKTSFVKPEFLNKAQRANPHLYDIGCYNDNLALMSKMSHTPVKNENSKESFNKQTTLLEKQMDESILWDQKCKSSKELFKIKSSVDTIFDGVEHCKQTIAKRTYFGHIDPFIQNTIEGNFCPQIRRINADLEKFHLCLKEEMVADLRYFNSLEHEVDSLKSQLETQKTQFLNEIDRLSREYYYADHMNAILGVYTTLDEFTDLQCDYVDQVVKCERLEKELSKSNITSKSFEALQQHAIDLELALQQCQEQIKNDKAFKENQSKVFLKEREQYFEIQDLKAQLQDKGRIISAAVRRIPVFEDFRTSQERKTRRRDHKDCLETKKTLRNRSRILGSTSDSDLFFEKLRSRRHESLNSTNSGPTITATLHRIRSMRMWDIKGFKQYFRSKTMHTRKLIENGNSWVPISQTTEENGITTSKNEPFSLTFSQYPDAKSMFAAIETRFGAASVSDNTMYALMVKNLNGSNVLHQDLEQIHKDNLEAMDLKWQLSLLRSKEQRRHFKSMLAIDGKVLIGVNMAEDKFSPNMALIYGIFRLRATYKRGLDTVEAQLVTYRKNEVLFSEEVVVLKREVGIKQYEINTLKTEFEKLKQEKDAFDFKIEKFDKASKDLDQLLESQITDKSKKGLGYSAVPPPHPLIYNRPNKLDLSYYGLDEFKEPEFKGYGLENSKKESNVVKESENSKENSDKSLVKEQDSQVKSSFVKGCGSNTSKRVSEGELTRFFLPLIMYQ
ncbi:hypothetical protein Tco_0745099 [Tanacetum coccineum]